jgi:hypothetical protein
MKDKTYIKIECILTDEKLERKVVIQGFSLNEVIGILEGVKYDMIKRNEENIQ